MMLKLPQICLSFAAILLATVLLGPASSWAQAQRQLRPGRGAECGALRGVPRGRSAI